MTEPRSSSPIGRDAELHLIDRFLIAIERGPAGLAVEGPAGIGKSTLVAVAIDEAARRGFQVLSARPSGAEATWAYQSLADLFGGAGEEVLATLPAPQRRALEVALVRLPSDSSDETSAPAQAISVATVSILRSLARDRPVLITVDDAPWLDGATASVLAFAARRLGGRPIGVLVTQRAETPGPVPLELENAVTTERAWLGPLSLGAVHLILTERLGLSLPRPTLARLHELAAGNPFHALEIGRALQQLPALPRPGEPLPVPSSVRELIRSHLAALSEPAGATLLLAAAAGTPSIDDLRRAAGPATDAALEEAADLGLVTVAGGIVRFTHPSLASAVYEEGGAAARRRAHAILARIVAEPEARGRHLALATVLPNAEVAAALEEAARDARRRGAAETATDLARLSRERTPPDDAASRARRGLLLAGLLVDIADLPAARSLLAELIEQLPAGRDRAEARLLAGTVAWYIEPSRERGPVPHLLAALDDAAGDQGLLGRLHHMLGIFYDFDLAAARRHAVQSVDLLRQDGPSVTLAGAMFGLFLTTIARGDPPPLDLLEEGLAIEAGRSNADHSTIPGIWYLAIDRADLARERFRWMLEESRSAGEAAGEADLLTRLAETEIYADRWDEALTLANEARMVAQQEGQENANPARRAQALALAHLGRLAEARAMALPGLASAEATGDDVIAAAYLQVLVFIATSEGGWSEVDTLAERSASLLAGTGRLEPLRLDTTHERLEALVALGRLEEAEDHVEQFAERARTVPRPWADAALARGRARLLAARGRLDLALAATDPALDARSSAWRRFDRARTLLVRGEILRLLRSRREAGDALDGALGIFDGLGAAVWAERTRTELDRLGRRRPGTEELTPTERRVAVLAASGLRNREVADDLRISPKTVEAHLAKAYAKLGIRSRAELGRAIGPLPEADRVP